jgi:phosphoketolase
MAASAGPLPGEQARALDAYWRAANYLSAGQIYLMANPLLAEPLRAEHISVPGAAVRTLVIAAREDIEIARQTRAALAAA